MAGAASIVIGVQAGSMADVVSSSVLLWLFRGELHGRHASHVVERRACRVSSVALVVVAVGIGDRAIVWLARGEGASPQAAAFAMVAVWVVVLALFAVVNTGSRPTSRAVRYGWMATSLWSRPRWL
jgi:hypothetical protein